MSDQKICPTCGTEYPLSERFCPRDGTALRSSNATGDLIGSIIAERYHILKKLGEGGMGTVYLAEHVKMGRKAALKVMNPGMNADPDAIARFNREAANASRLNHPNVCGIYDFGETPDGVIYLAMEFIEGESLTSVIEKNGSLPAPRAASIIHQAADALAVAHDYGIVHRDLKPDNIMIAKGRDGGDVVKVVDFGIAKASSSDAQKVTKTGLVVGTPEYMSPEQLAGDKLDGRSDIYSLGLVAFNCLTGVLPFPSNSAQETMIMRLTDQPKTLAEMKPGVDWPPELQAVMDRVLQRDANERYQKSAEFGRDIAKAVEHMPAAVAAAAGTMVIGASAAPVPPTRAAPRGGATAKIEAPAVPAAAPAAPAAATRKSPALMIAAAVVVIGGIAAAVVMKGGASGAVPPTGGAQSTQAGGGQSTQPGGAQASPAGSRAGAAPDGKAAERPNAPPPAEPQTKRDVSPRDVQTTHKAADAPGTAGPSTPAESAASVVAHWDGVINSGTPTPADAVHAIDALTPLIPKLSGEQRSNAVYVRMMAYGLSGNDTELCKAVKEVLDKDTNSLHVSTAQAAASARQCK